MRKIPVLLENLGSSLTKGKTVTEKRNFGSVPFVEKIKTLKKGQEHGKKEAVRKNHNWIR